MGRGGNRHAPNQEQRRKNHSSRQPQGLAPITYAAACQPGKWAARMASGLLRRERLPDAATRNATLYAGLQSGLNALEVGHRPHRLPVDLGDDVVGLKADVVGEGSRVHAGHQHAALFGKSGILQVGRFQVPDIDSKHRFRALSAGRPTRAGPGDERILGIDLGPVADRNGKVGPLAVPDYAQGGLRANLSLRHGVDQIVVLLDRSSRSRRRSRPPPSRPPCRRGCRVARTSRRRPAKRHRPLTTRASPLGARHADRTADHLAGLDDLVVDLDGGVDGEREAHAR